uniref:Uncharacterized protein n=1 Tax=Arundo donax TaxID=35708 RepID=A0A0A9ELP5_ARUDO
MEHIHRLWLAIGGAQRLVALHLDRMIHHPVVQGNITNSRPRTTSPRSRTMRQRLVHLWHQKWFI